MPIHKVTFIIYISIYTSMLLNRPLHISFKKVITNELYPADAK